jgi:hypothetical protein
MGDAVLVYFGGPQAHADDAKPSVRAGRELTGAASALRSTVPLQASVGRATAPIIVWDPIGTGAAQKRSVVGEAPKLAARLHGLSGPTKSSLPMAREDPSTDRARGREQELQLPSLAVPSRTAVKARLATVWRGWHRQIAAHDRLLARIACDPHKRLRHFCSPQHMNSALHPIIDQLRYRRSLQLIASCRRRRGRNWTKGLQLLVSLTEGRAGDQHELELRSTRIVTLTQTRGSAAPARLLLPPTSTLHPPKGLRRASVSTVNLCSPAPDCDNERK